MQYKYGTYPDNQFHSFKKKIHSLIHWLLVYAETDNECLGNYFDLVQSKLDGLNALLNYPAQIIEIMTLVECARVEYAKNDYDFNRFRHYIFDAHNLVDLIGEKDE